jgi:hypothetical protein
VPIRRPLGPSKPYTAKAKKWFVKELEVGKQYKVLSINEFGKQRVIYRTKPKGLRVRYFT